MSDRQIEIIDAVLEDALKIEATLISAQQASPTPLPFPERPYAVQAMMDSIAQGLVGVAKQSDKVVGVVVLGWWGWPWNRQVKWLVNMHWWVEPEYRSGGTAKKLLDWAKNKSDELQLPLRLEITYGGEDAGKLDTFIKRQGMEYTGGSFLYIPV